MATVLVVAGFVGAGLWVAMRLERGLDTAATLAKGAVSDRARGQRGGCRTPGRVYPVRCACGRLRHDAANSAVHHAARRASPGPMRGASRPARPLAGAASAANNEMTTRAHLEGLIGPP
jgi:hypothetical protein